MPRGAWWSLAEPGRATAWTVASLDVLPYKYLFAALRHAPPRPAAPRRAPSPAVRPVAARCGVERRSAHPATATPRARPAPTHTLREGLPRFGCYRRCHPWSVEMFPSIIDSVGGRVHWVQLGAVKIAAPVIPL